MHRMLQMHLDRFLFINSLKNINVPRLGLQRHVVPNKSVNHSIWKMNGAFRTSLASVSDECATRDLQRPHRGGRGGRALLGYSHANEAKCADLCSLLHAHSHCSWTRRKKRYKSCHWGFQKVQCMLVPQSRADFSDFFDSIQFILLFLNREIAGI